MTRRRRRLVPLLLLFHFAVSCGSPSCLDLTYLPNEKPLVWMILFSDPMLESGNSSAPRVSGWDSFQRASRIVIYDNGRMMVSSLNSWGESCPTVSQADLIELSEIWAPLFRKVRGVPLSPAQIRMMADPDTWRADWRPDGPLIELRLNSPFGKNVAILWDGSPLSTTIGSPVIRTLEIACSTSPRARKYLVRDLPQQVSSVLKCN